MLFFLQCKQTSYSFDATWDFLSLSRAALYVARCSATCSGSPTSSSDGLSMLRFGMERQTHRLFSYQELASLQYANCMARSLVLRARYAATSPTGISIRQRVLRVDKSRVFVLRRVPPATMLLRQKTVSRKLAQSKGRGLRSAANPYSSDFYHCKGVP